MKKSIIDDPLAYYNPEICGDLDPNIIGKPKEIEKGESSKSKEGMCGWDPALKGSECAVGVVLTNDLEKHNPRVVDCTVTLDTETVRKTINKVYGKFANQLILDRDMDEPFKPTRHEARVIVYPSGSTRLQTNDFELSSESKAIVKFHPAKRAREIILPIGNREVSHVEVVHSVGLVEILQGAVRVNVSDLQLVNRDSFEFNIVFK
jgi:hypothetical protein